MEEPVPLNVELVSVERQVWSGEASMVSARTTVGSIGILPHHAPLLAELAEGHDVVITQTSGGTVTTRVSGGFLSVTDEGVTILAERAEMDGQSA